MSDSENDLVGQVLLGKLEVKRRLGGGGMGVVYEVEHRLTGHRRALKVVHAKFADRPRFMKRLLREAKVAGTLDTKHVVETYDAGRLEDGSAYVLMELLKGRSLFEAMQAEGKMAALRMANITAQVAEGMAVAHEAGIVHRDLKPENIFLVEGDDGEERVKILDFGVSKFELGTEAAPNRLTKEGTLVGTPYYMSPEQAGGKPVDARSDVYAMGIILYEGLTGRLPFDADSVGELFVKIGAGECVPLRIRRPDVGERWHDLVHRCFHRDPERRYASAEALRRDLLALAGSATTSRARTISDGGRNTVDYEPETAAEKGLIAIAKSAAASEVHQDDVVTEPPPDDEQADASATPPPKASTPIPGWVWAAAGAALVLAVGVPWALTQGNSNRIEFEENPELAEVTAPGDEPTTDESTSDEPTRADPPTEVPGEPTEEESVAAPGTSDAGPERTAVADRPPANTPAHAAGLDPNPYRR